MALIHSLTHEDGTRVQIGTHRYTMQEPAIAGLQSWVNLPCFECREPIRKDETYYVASVTKTNHALSGSSALVHAIHVDHEQLQAVE